MNTLYIDMIINFLKIQGQADYNEIEAHIVVETNDEVDEAIDVWNYVDTMVKEDLLNEHQVRLVGEELANHKPPEEGIYISSSYRPTKTVYSLSFKAQKLKPENGYQQW